MPFITQIANAVVATLNAASLSQPVSATRAYLPRAGSGRPQDAQSGPWFQQRGERLGLTVLSLSRMSPSTWPSRRSPATNRTPRFDPLLALAEEIGDLFRAKRLETFPLAACVKTEFKTIYAPEHIETCGHSPAF